MTKRSSSRRNSVVHEPKKMPSFCEIVVEGYGNGLEQRYHLEDKPYTLEVDEDSAVDSTPAETNAFALFDFGLVATNGEPTLEHHQLDGPDDERSYEHYSESMDSSPRDSHTSADFELHRVPSLSSSVEHNTPCTDVASWAEEYAKRDSHMSEVSIVSDDHFMTSSPLSVKLHSYIPSKHDGGSKTSVNAGCYTPTGMKQTIQPPRSRFASQHRKTSSDTLASDTSSVYLEGATQADDIEEEDARGRRRSRALDGFARFGAAARNGFVS